MTVILHERRRSRAPLAFAILGIIAGLVAGGTIYYREYLNRPTGGSPVETVEQFLTAVLVDEDPSQVATVVCGGWDPADAMRVVTAEMPRGAAVGWQDVQLMSTDDRRAIVGATITLTPFQDEEPSDYINWSFSVVQDDGWRVCEARPIV